MKPAAPSELSRTGFSGSLVIDGVFIPEGAMVGTAAWADSRNEKNFGDPGLYRPERWMVNEESGNTGDDVARFRACFQPFSAGPGNCVGRNLAWLEMLLVVSRTLYRMDVRLAPAAPWAKVRRNSGGEGGTRISTSCWTPSLRYD